jgi:DNA-binding CsgD family transcriptional regulator
MSRALALKPDQEDDIWRLWLQRVPQAEIGRRIGCSRKTVSAAVQRVQKRLAAERTRDLEEARAEALAEYDTVKGECWERLAGCKPTSTAAVGYLGAILDARRQQDRLLNLEHLTVNVRAVALGKIEALLEEGIPLILPGADGTPNHG